ncbi:UPF0182 family protein [Gordonia asplenii]
MPTLSRRSKIAIGIGVGILVVLLVGPRVVGVTTDWMWFSQVGYSSVYARIVWTRVAMFLVAAVVVGLIIFGALAAAYRARPVFVPASSGVDPLARYRTTVMTHLRWFSIAPAVIIGVLAGLVAQGSWATLQMFWHSESFGKRDPQFNLDISFYAFELPFYRFLLNFFFVIVVVAFLGNLLTHYIFGGIRLGSGRSGSALTVAARVQLGVLAGIFLLLKAVAYWFDRYSLLSSDRRGDIFTGMTYTDANAVLPSKLILMAIAVICAAAFFGGIVLRDLRIPAMATALMLLSALAIGVLWPAAMEQFSVKPNAAQKERAFIERNIAATRDAYGIGGGDVKYERNWTSQPADPAKVNADSATLSNIRILDPNVISPVFNQRQGLKNFYGFPNQLAVDRYQVDGQMRDYIVAVRELNPNGLDENQQNWINKHTVYTHGNGFIAAPANTVDAASSEAGSDRGGFPIFKVSDLENYQTEDYKKNAPIKVTQPRIYFGEMIAKVSPDYAIVGSQDGTNREYDEDNEFYTYNGPAGVSLGNWFNRFLYSVKYMERNMLLSGAINSNSKIIYNRDPRDRVKAVAPWLTVDSKSYPAVMADGSIKWIVDGYTTLDDYPYAQKTSLQEVTTDTQDLNQGQTGRSQINRQVAYARNSVKATVDAYTGEVQLYQFDTSDPVLKTWMKVFPGSVKSRADFDKVKGLADHVRYPEDLFKMQRALLARYHVSDPDTFFRGNDIWSLPADPTKDNNSAGLSQPPYFFTAAAPNGTDASFQLTTVMTVLQKPFLAAYMTASSDPKTYGQITVKVLPTNKQTVGPQQAQENLKSSGQVASDRKQVEDTTKVSYGNLLTLPVGGNGLLYVQPMYTQSRSDSAAVPKLYRILVYYVGPDGSGQVGYAATVAEALRQVGINPTEVTKPGSANPVEGQTPDTTTPTPTPTPQNPQGSDGARDAAVKAIGTALEALKAAQTKGDFKAYGDALADLDKAVAAYEALGTK